jgi:hypothetical protein
MDQEISIHEIDSVAVVLNDLQQHHGCCCCCCCFLPGVFERSVIEEEVDVVHEIDFGPVVVYRSIVYYKMIECGGWYFLASVTSMRQLMMSAMMMTTA